MIFKVSLEGVKRIDISFASETIVELARRYRGKKGLCFIDLVDPDMAEDWDAAAARKAQPLVSWDHGKARTLGVSPSQGTLGAFEFALKRPRTRAAEFAVATKACRSRTRVRSSNSSGSRDSYCDGRMWRNQVVSSTATTVSAEVCFLLAA
jgi:hypothetical protein